MMLLIAYRLIGIFQSMLDERKGTTRAMSGSKSSDCSASGFDRPVRLPGCHNRSWLPRLPTRSVSSGSGPTARDDESRCGEWATRALLASGVRQVGGSMAAEVRLLLSEDG